MSNSKDSETGNVAKKKNQRPYTIAVIILTVCLSLGLITYERRLVAVHKALQQCRKTTKRIKSDNEAMKEQLKQVITALDTCNKTFTKTKDECVKMQHACSGMMSRCKMIIHRRLNCRRPSYILRRM